MQQAWVFLRILLLRSSVLLCLCTHNFYRLSRWVLLVNWLFGLSLFRCSCCWNIADVCRLRYWRRRRDQHDILRQCVHAQLGVYLARYTALKALEDDLSRRRCSNAILSSGWAELLASICLLTFWCVISSSTAACVLCGCLCLCHQLIRLLFFLDYQWDTDLAEGVATWYQDARYVPIGVILWLTIRAALHGWQWPIYFFLL